jgi:hypothetical protein
MQRHLGTFPPRLVQEMSETKSGEQNAYGLGGWNVFGGEKMSKKHFFGPKNDLHFFFFFFFAFLQSCLKFNFLEKGPFPSLGNELQNKSRFFGQM